MGKKGNFFRKVCPLEAHHKEIGILLIISISLFLCINLISAVPPISTTQQFTEGYSVQIPQDNILQVGKDYEFDFHVFNVSNGFPKTSGISCDLHIYDEIGYEFYAGTDSTASATGDYSFNISSSNFTKPARYYYFVRCNSSTLGGFGESILLITYTGEEVSLQTLYIYIIALIFIVLLLMGTVFIIGKLPSKDATDEEGTIVQVSMLKHLRMVLWAFVWGISMAAIFIISNLGIAYLDNKMIGNFFFMIYRIQFYVLVIGLPVYFCWIIYKIFKDKEMKRLMKRGIEFGGKGL